jgi:Domain of unknown function (DUF397)
MDLTGARWRKSSYSGNSGGDCVEVAAVWRKSSHSGANGGDCVEVAAVAARRDAPDAIAVRDSKDPDGPKLIFTPAQWHIFASAARAGEFDLA